MLTLSFNPRPKSFTKVRGFWFQGEHAPLPIAFTFDNEYERASDAPFSIYRRFDVIVIAE